MCMQYYMCPVENTKMKKDFWILKHLASFENFFTCLSDYLISHFQCRIPGGDLGEHVGREGGDCVWFTFADLHLTQSRCMARTE